jgi:hypothetical protein
MRCSCSCTQQLRCMQAETRLQHSSESRFKGMSEVRKEQGCLQPAGSGVKRPQLLWPRCTQLRCCSVQLKKLRGARQSGPASTSSAPEGNTSSAQGGRSRDSSCTTWRHGTHVTAIEENKELCCACNSSATSTISYTFVLKLYYLHLVQVALQLRKKWPRSAKRTS